jgi:uncharacterized SAM-dependent methyltransferase
MSGAKLWEKLADEEETYPISRSDTSLLLSNLDEIADRVPTGLEMIDLAPGGENSVERSMQLGEAIGIESYRPKDASAKFVETAVTAARKRFPQSTVTPIVGDIYAGIEQIKIEGPTFAYFGGGTLSNIVHPISTRFPAELLRNNLERLFTYAPCGWLLLSFDTTNDETELMKRYGSKTCSDSLGNVMYRAEA